MIKKARGRPAKPLMCGDRVKHGERRGGIRTIYGTRTGQFVLVDWSDGTSSAVRPSQLKRY